MTYKPRCLECGGTDDYWRGFKVCEQCYGSMKDPYKHVRPGSSKSLCKGCEMVPASKFSKNGLCGSCMMDKSFEDALKSRKQRRKEKQQERQRERRKKQREKNKKKREKEKKRKQKEKDLDKKLREKYEGKSFWSRLLTW